MAHSLGAALVTGASSGIGAVMPTGSPNVAATSSSWRATPSG